MSKRAIRTVLLVEDNCGDARLLREMFKEANQHPVSLHCVGTLALAETLLASQDFDLIVLDLGLPDAQGLEAVRRINAAAPSVPLVVLTGLDDEHVAAQAMQEGAQDYLIKGEIETRGLLRAMRYAVERKFSEETARRLALEITHSAEHDFLTGLPNRVLLSDRIGVAIAFAERHRRKAALLFLDLDGFKHVNDSLGHPTGDRLLQSIAGRLLNCVRSCDTVSRQGGDEFVVLLSEVEHAEDAAVIARRMLKVVKEAHAIDGHDLHVTTSIGLSVYPDDGLNASALLKTADTAMYQAKDMGRDTYRFFAPVMNARAVERQAIEEGLRRALEREEFMLHYQPKICLRTGAIIGAEALLRWAHPVRGLVPPSQFIPVAEDCGLIRPIGEWVLQNACAQARTWQDIGLSFGTMAVNVSAVQFMDESFLGRLLTILDETGLDPKLLELELTESVLMKRVESTASLLQSLREKGVQIAIDDFGTGYSSLSYLQRFPVDILKIDQSFVQKIGGVDGGGTLVTAVIDMARALNVRVIAEGVETLAQIEFLAGLKCDEAQGYYFSTPVPAASFAALFRSGALTMPHLAAAA
jgi:diguanylate cyclase (GGDEF)-like protein